MTSIVIPAHDEEAVIGRCLSALLKDASPGEFEVIVACNGCHDGTADVARSFDGVTVVETPVAGKPAGLNLGDAAATSFPRIYVDADVELDTSGLRALAERLRTDRAIAGAPRLQLDLRGASRGVLAFYRIWTRAAWVRDGLVGSGVYAMSEAGRARFQAFPDIIADDLFVRSLFADAERVVLSDHTFVNRPPRTLRGLVRTRGRVFAGNFEFRSRGFEVAQRPRADAGGVGSLVRARPALLPAALVYLTVQALAKLGGYRHWRTGQTDWRRDATARVAAD